VHRRSMASSPALGVVLEALAAGPVGSAP